ncbi:hypothetical protein SPAR_03971, partial [Streptomyces sparsogenes DSM 40356]
LGCFLGAGARAPVGGGPDAGHPSGIATAERLGGRVAWQTAYLLAGRATRAA